ncbi:hypothetical protein BDQ17DRAFT_1434623 [Cyathus striatus]|nr:hypothetical protein BDQ17DRAFT_1434623 [Cyathus striatus]
MSRDAFEMRLGNLITLASVHIRLFDSSANAIVGRKGPSSLPCPPRLLSLLRLFSFLLKPSPQQILLSLPLLLIIQTPESIGDFASSKPRTSKWANIPSTHVLKGHSWAPRFIAWRVMSMYHYPLATPRPSRKALRHGKLSKVKAQKNLSSITPEKRREDGVLAL